jgi:hypothetical protein
MKQEIGRRGGTGGRSRLRPQLPDFGVVGRGQKSERSVRLQSDLASRRVAEIGTRVACALNPGFRFDPRYQRLKLIKCDGHPPSLGYGETGRPPQRWQAERSPYNSRSCIRLIRVIRGCLR